MSSDDAAGMSVSVWKGGAIFEHVSPTGVSYCTDAVMGSAHNPLGPTPMEAVLGALTGCTGVDFVSILEKMRLRIMSLRAETSCERASDHPRVYTRIHTDYWLETDPIDMRRALRAFGLAAGKYCSVSSMLMSTTEISYTLHYGGQEHGGVIRGPEMG